MPYQKLVAFDRPLTGAVLPGRGRLFTESELNARIEDAYRRGVDAARAAADQQLVELRHDMEQLGAGVLEKLSGFEGAMTAQMREALPPLAVEIARRLLAGFEPSAETVERLCREALDHLYPERDGLELALCPRDAELLASVKPDWLQAFPGLRIRADATLRPGDCLVRSRFGLTDARQQTKLAALREGVGA
jgi:flagellar assembly protein FliH